MNRTKQYQRFQAQKHIRRKERIIHDVYRYHDWDPWTGDKGAHNRLNKGKVHCSCCMCSFKTKSHGWKHSDKKKLLSMDEQLL